jgi:DNA-binding NarL/FixJ family response regulator
VTGSRPRCLVADDHPALLLAVTGYLAANGFEIVGSVDDGERAAAVAEREQPDLALFDYRMPRGGGAELVRRVKAVSPATEVAVYTADADEALVDAALTAGAAAVVLKEAPLVDLVRALHTILEGRPYLDAALGAGSLRPAGRAGSPLTAREADVLRLLAEGLSHAAVGRRLAISAETARTHLRKASERLGAATRTEAVARAIRLGLID